MKLTIFKKKENRPMVEKLQEISGLLREIEFHIRTQNR